jgi:hypothetical protein
MLSWPNEMVGKRKGGQEIMAGSRIIMWVALTAGKWLGKDEHGLATAILTKRNSVAIRTVSTADARPAVTAAAICCTFIARFPR